MATATKKAAARVRSNSSTNLGPRKSKWLAEFNQLFAKFKRAEPGSMEFIGTCHKLRVIASRFIRGMEDDGPHDRLEKAVPAVYDPDAAKLAGDIRAALNNGDGLFRPQFFVKFDIDVYKDACQSRLCFASDTIQRHTKDVTAENMATVIVANIRQDAAELLKTADKIERKFVAKSGRKPR